MIERLKQLRKVLKMNQTNFAKELGITQTAYSMIISIHTPAKGVTAKINKIISFCK